MSAATTLLFTVAVGFLAAALMTPAGEQPVERRTRAQRPTDDVETTRLDDMMMEKTK